jgi:hypothetical protein
VSCAVVTGNKKREVRGAPWAPALASHDPRLPSDPGSDPFNDGHVEIFVGDHQRAILATSNFEHSKQFGLRASFAFESIAANAFTTRP